MEYIMEDKTSRQIILQMAIDYHSAKFTNNPYKPYSVTYPSVEEILNTADQFRKFINNEKDNTNNI